MTETSNKDFAAAMIVRNEGARRGQNARPRCILLQGRVNLESQSAISSVCVCIAIVRRIYTYMYIIIVEIISLCPHYNMYSRLFCTPSLDCIDRKLMIFFCH